MNASRDCCAVPRRPRPRWPEAVVLSLWIATSPAWARAAPADDPTSAPEHAAPAKHEPGIEDEPDSVPEAEAELEAEPETEAAAEPEAVAEPEPQPPLEPLPEPLPARTLPPPGLAAAPAVEPSEPVRVRPLLDLTITLGIAAPTAALGLWVDPSLSGEAPTPGVEPDVGKFDRVALGRFSTAPNIAADVLVAVAVAAPFTYHAVEAAMRRRGWSNVRGRGFLVRYGTDVVIIAQTMAINTFVTQLFKSSIRRPRPYAYLDPSEVDPELHDALVSAQSSHLAARSFPSGHTSTAFAATTAGATLLTLELLGRSRWPIAVSWAGGLALASTVGTLRVVSGKHFPSDVVTGALIGIAAGTAVPLAHWHPPRVGDVGRRRSTEPPRWTLVPRTSSQFAGLILIGRPRPIRLTRAARR